MAKNTKYPKLGGEADLLPELQGGGPGREKINSYPIVRTDITLQELGWAPGSNIAKLHKYSKTYNYWVDNLLTSGPADVFYTQARPRGGRAR